MKVMENKLKLAIALEESFETAHTICDKTPCFKCKYKDYGIPYCLYAMQADILKGIKENGKQR